MKTSIATLVSLLVSACGQLPPPKPPYTQQRPLDALVRVAAYPNSETLTLMNTMQLFIASHREREGYDYFGQLAREQPQRAVQLESFQAVMQARLANQVPLLKRIAWVEDAIAKLDAGAAADPLLGRFARGLVFADLPDRFGKTQQAIADLEASLARSTEFPVNLDRGIYRALAVAYHKTGDEVRSKEMLRRSGFAKLDDLDARFFGDASLQPQTGFRFSRPRLVREADGVYVAEGYDFANIGFIVGRSFVVAIDAGTTEPSARAALAALREHTQQPIKYIVLTHAHWDHAGGLKALREPGTIVIASAGFPKQLQNTRDYPPPFHYFFGSETSSLDLRPDRLITARETLADDDVTLELLPAHSGETEDALFIRDVAHDVLFVGDALMPYTGAPFVAEGSPEGYLAAISDVLELAPHRVIHGHPPLTALFTPEALPGLRDALTALYQRSLAAARSARPVAELLHDNYLPDALRDAPKAVMPYLVVRDMFVQRVYTEHAGYWRSNGDGVESFTRAEWAGALDALSGNSDAAFSRVADELERRGDAGMALQIAELGLVRHPKSEALAQSKARALATLRLVNAQMNPFRFIVYSELAQRSLPAVAH